MIYAALAAVVFISTVFLFLRALLKERKDHHVALTHLIDGFRSERQELLNRIQRPEFIPHTPPEVEPSDPPEPDESLLAGTITD